MKGGVGLPASARVTGVGPWAFSKAALPAHPRTFLRPRLLAGLLAFKHDPDLHKQYIATARHCCPGYHSGAHASSY
eukprot:scaffold425629_cov15-Prasinocladus_malaysianus.AAC.1